MFIKYRNTKINGTKIKQICESFKLACTVLGLNQAKSLKKLLTYVAAATELNDLKNLAHFEFLTGDRNDQCSMRISANYRLIFTQSEIDNVTVIIINIEDYH